MKKIDRVKKHFVEESLEIALSGHPKEWEPEKKVDDSINQLKFALYGNCSNRR